MCTMIIGDGNPPYGSSFKGTVIPLINIFDLTSFCFEDLKPNFNEDLFFLSHPTGNVSTKHVHITKLCEREGRILVKSHKRVNGFDPIQTDYCQAFGGRYFKNGELEALQEELIEGSRGKCQMKRGGSMLVWTEERCKTFNLITLLTFRSCYPVKACFLCFIPNPHITLKSDRLGYFYDLILAEREGSEDQFTLESEELVITQLNGTWHLNFKHLEDSYYLNSSHLPFGENEWHGQLEKGVTDVISIDNCLLRQSCKDGSCYTHKENSYSMKFCKDGSDEVLERFPYFLDRANEGGDYHLGTCSQLNLRHYNNSFYLIRLNYDGFLREMKDVKLEDKRLEISLGFSFDWRDDRVEIKQATKQEINGAKLPFSPSVNLVLTNCEQKENLLRNISNTKYWIRQDTNDGGSFLWNNFTATFSLPCQFVYHKFPFGRQSCSVCLSMKGCDPSNVVFQFKRNIIYDDSEAKIGAFVLRDISQKLHDNSTVEIQIQLDISSRLLNFYTLTSFVPTLIMCFIAYCTLYFNMKHFAERIGLSATSLLTLVVLFTDVIERIGVTTSYVKFIDSWFIGSMTFTALIVVINAILHYLIWHGVYGCECLHWTFSSCRRVFKKGRTGSMDILGSGYTKEMRSVATVENYEMESSNGNPPRLNGPPTLGNFEVGSAKEQSELPRYLGWEINLGARIVFFVIMASSLMALVILNILHNR